MARPRSPPHRVAVGLTGAALTHLVHRSMERLELAAPLGNWYEKACLRGASPLGEGLCEACCEGRPRGARWPVRGVGRSG